METPLLNVEGTYLLWPTTETGTLVLQNRLQRAGEGGGTKKMPSVRFVGMTVNLPISSPPSIGAR